MKRIFICIVVLSLVSFFIAAPVAAEGNKVSTTLTLKNDWSMPKEGDSSAAQKMTTYWSYQEWGGGVDLTYKGQDNFVQVKPFASYNIGNWYLVGGLSLDNNSEYFNAGFWYTNAFGKYDVFLDVRNYFATSGGAEGYLDNFLEISRPISEKFYAGVDLIYDYWWNGKRDWYLIGPLLGYKLNNSTSIFARYSHEWDVLEDETRECDNLRIGITFKF